MAQYKTPAKMVWNKEIADRLSLPVPNTKRSGDPVQVGCFVGVCETDGVNPGAKSGINHNHETGNANVALKGVYALKVTVTGAGAKTGDPVFILPDDTLTTDIEEEDAKFFGVVYEGSATVAAGTDKEIQVFLAGVSAPIMPTEE